MPKLWGFSALDPELSPWLHEFIIPCVSKPLTCIHSIHVIGTKHLLSVWSYQNYYFQGHWYLIDSRKIFDHMNTRSLATMITYERHSHSHKHVNWPNTKWQCDGIDIENLTKVILSRVIWIIIQFFWNDWIQILNTTSLII